MKNKTVCFILLISQVLFCFSQVTTNTENENTVEEATSNQELTQTNETSKNNLESLQIEQSFISSNNQLRLYKYEDEVLNITNNKYGIKEVVTATDNILIRKEYDSLMRIIKCIEWEKKDGQWIRLFETEYTFSNDNNYPEMSIQRFLTEKKMIKNLYDTKGYVIQTQEFFSESAEAVSEEDYKLLKEERYTFDANHKILVYRLFQDENTYITENDYSKGLLYPDVKKYEIKKNSKKKLREEYVYETDEYYVRTIFFDNDNKTVSIYEKDALISIIYYQGEKELRRQDTWN